MSAGLEYQILLMRAPILFLFFFAAIRATSLADPPDPSRLAAGLRLRRWRGVAWRGVRGNHEVNGPVNSTPPAPPRPARAIRTGVGVGMR